MTLAPAWWGCNCMGDRGHPACTPRPSHLKVAWSPYEGNMGRCIGKITNTPSRPNRAGQLFLSPISTPPPERQSIAKVTLVRFLHRWPPDNRTVLGSPVSPYRIQNPPPPRKSPKITQKLQFGPPQACPQNYRKLLRSVIIFSNLLVKITLLSNFSVIFGTGPGWAKL